MIHDTQGRVIDVLVSGGPSLLLFEPQNDEAFDWLESNLQTEGYQWLGRNVGVEWRYAGDIITGLQDEGFVVSR